MTRYLLLLTLISCALCAETEIKLDFDFQVKARLDRSLKNLVSELQHFGTPKQSALYLQLNVDETTKCLYLMREQLSRYNNVIVGEGNTLNGDQNIIVGNYNSVNGSDNFVFLDNFKGDINGSLLLAKWKIQLDKKDLIRVNPSWAISFISPEDMKKYEKYLNRAYTFGGTQNEATVSVIKNINEVIKNQFLTEFKKSPKPALILNGQVFLGGTNQQILTDFTENKLTSPLKLPSTLLSSYTSPFTPVNNTVLLNVSSIISKDDQLPKKLLVSPIEKTEANNSAANATTTTAQTVQRPKNQNTVSLSNTNNVSINSVSSVSNISSTSQILSQTTAKPVIKLPEFKLPLIEKPPTTATVQQPSIAKPLIDLLQISVPKIDQPQLTRRKVDQQLQLTLPKINQSLQVAQSLIKPPVITSPSQPSLTVNSNPVPQTSFSVLNWNFPLTTSAVLDTNKLTNALNLTTVSKKQSTLETINPVQIITASKQSLTPKPEGNLRVQNVNQSQNKVTIQDNVNQVPTLFDIAFMDITNSDFELFMNAVPTSSLLR